ncbi:snRNA-activating protein complex subunit 3 isoform X2 [Octopus sinensis]|nr:snRNA-activating protein complex subunit 3 isoform X2 [Octopus sinensis]XP_036354649.1 snRNA-activating protein complex subunit 3 isoform X2 [Octopus sinensis]XP_036354650.1 snRNA-activating protein complex subunit 3 isoform X2 [Octopus sinensis]
MATRQSSKPSASSEVPFQGTSGELIKISEFIESWKQMSEYDLGTVKSEKQYIQDAMDLNDADYYRQAVNCSDQLLFSGDEIKARFPCLNIFTDDVKLMSVKLQEMDVKQRNADPLYKKNVLLPQKPKILDVELLADEVRPLPPDEHRVVTPDALLLISLYKSRETGRNVSRSISLAGMGLEHAFAVLGQQKLTELRDRICCVNDLLVTGDYSEDPDLDINLCARDIFKAGYFFIEDIFYDDTRHADSLKYSDEVIAWAAKSGTHYKSLPMEDTKFSDLSLRIGYPYVYMHQGNCEHLLVVSDIRMLHPHDSFNILDYPYLVKRPSKKRTICRICAFDSARWMTEGSFNSLEDPSFYCQVCFRSIHYDQNGKKIGNFKAYKYFDSHTVL